MKAFHLSHFRTDDIMTCDVPATIDLVLEKTGSDKLQYIGWSQGGEILFGFLAEHPEYNEKVGSYHRVIKCEVVPDPRVM